MANTVNKMFKTNFEMYWTQIMNLKVHQYGEREMEQMFAVHIEYMTRACWSTQSTEWELNWFNFKYFFENLTRFSY